MTATHDLTSLCGRGQDSSGKKLLNNSLLLYSYLVHCQMYPGTTGQENTHTPTVIDHSKAVNWPENLAEIVVLKQLAAVSQKLQNIGPQLLFGFFAIRQFGNRVQILRENNRPIGCFGNDTNSKR